MFLLITGLAILSTSCYGANNCQRCVSTDTTMAALVGVGGNGLDLTGVPTHADCHSSASAGDTVTCDNHCVTIITQSAGSGAKSWAVRSCADSLMSSSLWTSLKLDNTASLSGCTTTAHAATDTTSTSEGRVCFCKGEKCNSHLWTDMNGAAGSTLSILLAGILLLTRFLLG